MKLRVITYGLDNEPGRSGSPIFLRTADQQRIVFAVHAYRHCGEGIGSRMAPALFQTMAVRVC